MRKGYECHPSYMPVCLGLPESFVSSRERCWERRVFQVAVTQGSGSKPCISLLLIMRSIWISQIPSRFFPWTGRNNKRIYKGITLLWHLLLHWIRITRNQRRIIVVMRIIHKEALCCWEFLVLEVQWGCPQMGGTHTHELLSLCVWGLSTQKFLIALVTQKHHFKPASRFCCCKWACSLFIGFQIKHSFILCLE